MKEKLSIAASIIILIIIIFFPTPDEDDSDKKPANKPMTAVVLSSYSNGFNVYDESENSIGSFCISASGIKITDGEKEITPSKLIAGTKITIEYDGDDKESYYDGFPEIYKISVVEYGEPSIEFRDYSFQTRDQVQTEDFSFRIIDKSSLDELIYKNHDYKELLDKINRDGGFSDESTYIMKSTTVYSGTQKLWVEAVYVKDGKLRIHQDYNIFNIGTDDIARCIVCVKIPKAELENVDLSEYDPTEITTQTKT